MDEENNNVEEEQPEDKDNKKNYLLKLKEGVYWTGKEIRYPLKKNIDEPFSFDNLDWKNLIGIRNTAMILMVLMILGVSLFGAYSYKNDTAECFELLENPIVWCSNYLNPKAAECTEELEKQGLCIRSDYNLDSSIIKFVEEDGKETNNI